MSRPGGPNATLVATVLAGRNMFRGIAFGDCDANFKSPVGMLNETNGLRPADVGETVIDELVLTDNRGDPEADVALMKRSGPLDAVTTLGEADIGMTWVGEVAAFGDVTVIKPALGRRVLMMLSPGKDRRVMPGTTTVLCKACSGGGGMGCTTDSTTLPVIFTGCKLRRW